VFDSDQFAALHSTSTRTFFTMCFTISLLSTSFNSQSEPLPKLFEFMPRVARTFLLAGIMFAISAYTNFPYHGKTEDDDGDSSSKVEEVYFWLSVLMFFGEVFSFTLVRQAKENRTAAHLSIAKNFVGVIGVVNLGFFFFRVLPGVDLHGDDGAMIALGASLFSILFSLMKSAAVFYILRNMKRRLDAGEDAWLAGASSDVNDGQTAAQRRQAGSSTQAAVAVATPMHNDGGKDTIPVASKV
jgi:hypothetical protein